MAGNLPSREMSFSKWHGSVRAILRSERGRKGTEGIEETVGHLISGSRRRLILVNVFLIVSPPQNAFHNETWRNGYTEQLPLLNLKKTNHSHE